MLLLILGYSDQFNDTVNILADTNTFTSFIY